MLPGLSWGSSTLGGTVDPPHAHPGDTPREPGCVIPFQQVEAELVAVGQGEQLHARAHSHEPLHFHCHAQYPGDLAKKVRADQTFAN